jgi:energy-coupling factor transporter ATP-binding protein EcfA2
VFDHEIPLQEEGRITIIHGMNGIGKTIVLRMIAEALTGKYDVLLSVPYERFELRLDDGSLLRASRAANGTTEWQAQTPTVVRVMPDGSEEIVKYHMLVDNKQQVTPNAPWLDALRNKMSVHLVGTTRLLTRPFAMEPPPGDEAEERVAITVQQCSEDIHLRIEQSQFSYNKQRNQDAQSFPARILSKNGNAPFSHDELQQRLMDLGRTYDAVSSYGILPPSEVIRGVPEDTDISTLKTLSIYVRDMASALTVFDDLIARLATLTEIVNSHIEYKRLAVRLGRGFVISARNGAEIAVTALSTGEQHELVMVYDLLFRTKPDTLVLIDEPEISLHLVWQQEFVNDLEKIVQVANIDVLIATHSSDIIDKHWDWTVALEGPSA